MSQSQKSQSSNGSSPATPRVELQLEGTFGFSTPNQNPIKNRLLENLKRDDVSRSPQLQLPASPMMARLGYGTGVGVFVLERSPRSTGIRSPWAIKKTINVEETSDIYAARLEYEAEVLRKLSHPNIIGYRAFGKSASDTAFLAMEKAPKSLADHIEDRIEEVMLFPDPDTDSKAPFPSKIMEKVALDIAKALEYLHDQVKMVHGDLKSANVLVFGDFEIAKLCDFGVSRKLDSNGYVEGGYVGTEIWNAKEVMEYKRGENPQKVTHKADIYPFGLTIHEMITLRPPHLSDAENSILDTETSQNRNTDAESSQNESFNNITFDELAYEDALQRLIGSRPPLPDIEFDPSYTNILGIFYCCTEEDPSRRPDAKDIVATLTELTSS